MPYKAATFRPHPQRPRKSDTRGSAASRGYDHRWRKFRASLIASDPLKWLTCAVCGETQRSTSDIELDHIQPLAEGGARLDPDNLQPLCGRCHRQKTAQERGRERGVP